MARVLQTQPRLGPQDTNTMTDALRMQNTEFKRRLTQLVFIPVFLEPYNKALGRLESELTTIGRDLTTDGEQIKRFKNLETQLQQDHCSAKTTIECHHAPFRHRGKKTNGFHARSDRLETKEAPNTTAP